MHRSTPQTQIFCIACCVTLVFATGCSYTVDEWWRRVVAVDPGTFNGIKHFTLQGIDYSHHFRFGYTDRPDLEAIILKHGLRPDATPTGFSSNSVPAWFSPPAGSNAYSNGDNDPSIVMWIDDKASVAYLELVKI